MNDFIILALIGFGTISIGYYAWIKLINPGVLFLKKKSKDIQFIVITWIIVIIINQIFIFHACVHVYCILAALPHTGIITALIYYFFYFNRDINTNTTKKNKNEDVPKKSQGNNYQHTTPTTNVKKESSPRPSSIYQQMGDDYEKQIGLKLEETGYIVVYNGFIKGYDDKGIDLLAISQQKKILNLIQCKNWRRKEIQLSDIETIYTKLDVHYNDFDIYYLPSIEIYNHTQLQNVDLLDIDDTMNSLRNNIARYTIRKTLYISSNKVVNLEVGKHLVLIKNNIFRYRDMKIVVEKS